MNPKIIAWIKSPGIIILDLFLILVIFLILGFGGD